MSKVASVVGNGKVPTDKLELVMKSSLTGFSFLIDRVEQTPTRKSQTLIRT